MKLRRRISARATPRRSAARSSNRSITNVPCERPAPRVAVDGTLLVKANVDFQIVGRKRVWPDQVGAAVVRQSDSIRRVRTMILEQLSLDAQEPAIGVERRLHVPFL